MAHVEFTRHLNRFFPDLQPTQIPAATVAELLAELDRRHPGLRAYLVDDRGALRKHVNVFVQDTLVHDRESLSDPLHDDSNVYILQALSGG